MTNTKGLGLHVCNCWAYRTTVHPFSPPSEPKRPLCTGGKDWRKIPLSPCFPDTERHETYTQTSTFWAQAFSVFKLQVNKVAPWWRTHCGKLKAVDVQGEGHWQLSPCDRAARRLKRGKEFVRLSKRGRSGEAGTLSNARLRATAFKLYGGSTREPLTFYDKNII